MIAPPDAPPALLTAREAAVWFHSTPEWVYQMSKKRLLPSIKLNGMLRFDPREIEAWIDAHRKPAVVS